MPDLRKPRVSGLHALKPLNVLNAKEGDHGDGGGLILRVRGESAAWLFKYTSPAGKRREMGLGTAHRQSLKLAGATLSAARFLAHTYREQLRAGVDPIDARDARRVGEREAQVALKKEKDRERWTLARCARDYHARVIEPNRTAKHAAQWIASLENHIPASVWNKPVGEVAPPELLKALLAITPHERARNHKSNRLPETVTRLRQRLDAVYEDAIFHERCASNPAAAIRRKLTEAVPNEKSVGLRALPYSDAPAFYQGLREQPGVAARCLEFLLLTVARTSEALLLPIDELDFASARWVVPAERMKAGEPHEVFLPPAAVELLQEQIALELHPTLVFPSLWKGGDGAMSNMALLAVLNRMGLRDKTTVHGLRATFSTWAYETAAARPDVIEACLAHSEQDKVKRAYNRAELAAERRALLHAWADFLHTVEVREMPLAA